MNNLTFNPLALLQNNTDYKKTQEEKWRKNFCEPLSKMIEEHVIPKLNWSGTFDIVLGNYSSGEYGSYKIIFKNEEKEIGYIIADIIFGEWKLFKSE